MTDFPEAYDRTPLAAEAAPTSKPRGDSPWSLVRRTPIHGPVTQPLLDLGQELAGRDHDPERLDRRNAII